MKSEWISVKDRLPKEAGTYIVAQVTGGGKRYVKTSYLDRKGEWSCEGVPNLNIAVTHWMPMPEPPVDETTADGCEAPMPITDSMKEKRKQEVGKLIAKVNKDIRDYAEHGLNSVCFSVDKDSPFYSEVRAAFEKAGYRIKPTGMSGGVWQTTEDIVW